jgi:hypothetical protein
MVPSHLVISDEMVIFVTYVSPFSDELDVVMELDSSVTIAFGHG